MPKRGYHHGNLKQALVEAALELIKTKGPGGWTIAQAAKTAEVTPAAVYRHFEGRKALIAECAIQGHQIFGDLMERAHAHQQPSVLDAFQETGRAYLSFARKYPGHYIAMFESGLSMHFNTDLARASSRSKRIFEQVIEQLIHQTPKDHRPPASMISAHIWALSHGVVELFARGDSSDAQAPSSPEDLLKTGLEIYVKGLGLIKPGG